jgi:hypothetical protein
MSAKRLATLAGIIAFVVWGWPMIRSASGPETDDAKMARRIAFGGMLVAAAKATSRQT